MTKSKYSSVVIMLLSGLILAACSDNSTPTTTTIQQPTTAAATQAATQGASTQATNPTVAAATASAANVEQVDPKAGNWKTWLLSSGNQFRPLAPSDQAASQTEIKQLKDMVSQRDAAALALITYWNTGGPSYRWNELLINY